MTPISDPPKPLALRHIRTVDEILRKLYNDPRHGNREDPFEELVYIVISQRTREAAYKSAFTALRNRFPSWEGLCDVAISDIEEILKPAGMWRLKSQQLKEIAVRLRCQFGHVTLDPLKRWSNPRALEFLTSLPRVGTKTALCVMMYSLNRQAFPADSNVIRVAYRLGLTNYGPIQHKKAQQALAGLVPEKLRYGLHVNLVSHGRYVCRARPACDRCELRKLCQYYRTRSQRKNSPERVPSMIDVFSGAGGMSEGFVRAGYRILLATDIDQVALDTYELNHPSVPAQRILRRDIRDVQAKHLKEFIGDRPIDVVVGGPPCQGFSIAGAGYRTNVNGCRFKDDPRNQLYREFLRVVSFVKPLFVIMENVPGILSAAGGSYAREIVEDFERLRPKYLPKVLPLQAAEFGVPQTRRRVFFVATLAGEGAGRRLDLLESELKTRTVDQSRRPKLWTAIRDLPQIAAGEGAQVMRGEPLRGRRDHYRALVCNGSRFILNHVARRHNDRDLELFALLRQGETAWDVIEKYHRPDLMVYRNDIWLDKYRRLSEQRPSPTITAHLSHMGNMFIHPRQARSLTVREAARLQSFKDDYNFLGGLTRQFRMIGNAVPPLMSEAIARSVRAILDQRSERAGTSR